MTENKSYMLDSPGIEKLDRLVELLLKIWLIGFDELKMDERTEVVELFGEKIKQGVVDFNKRLTILEERVHFLEKEKMK